MAYFSLLDLQGDLSVGLIATVWLLSVLVAVPLILARQRKTSEIASVQKAFPKIVLAVVWPFAAMLGLVLLPMLTILLVMRVLNRIAPTALTAVGSTIERIGKSLKGVAAGSKPAPMG